MGLRKVVVMGKSVFLQLLICLFLLPSPSHSIPFSSNSNKLSQFENQNFLFGTASSSYQFEGAPLADGKGLSNWDVFTHTSDGITDGSNGDIAVDQYHRYLEDVDLMEALNVNSYRFSISWARVLPKGRFGKVNMGGINYYNNLIDALLLKGIEPFITLCHYDIPQELEDRYGSLLSPEFQIDFAHYAETCFKHFGDRVKYWVTFNEPNVQVPDSYYTGSRPPCHCFGPFQNCKKVVDNESELYLAAHNIILSHAAAVDIYRTKYQGEHGGKIGMVLNAAWFEPLSNSKEDILASKRAHAWNMDWFLEPLIFGKYPRDLEEFVGNMLPTFSSKDKMKLNKSLDFIGINHYASYYVKDCISSYCAQGEWVFRSHGTFDFTENKDGVPLGEATSLAWLNVYPPGMTKAINYVRDTYNNTPIYITENGYGEEFGPNSTNDELNYYDFKRIDYMAAHLDAVLQTIRMFDKLTKNGADVRGYFAWSFLDNFEWNDGYTVKFGVYHVNLTTQKRTPRLSASWYKNFIQINSHNINKLSKLQRAII